MQPQRPAVERVRATTVGKCVCLQCIAAPASPGKLESKMKLQINRACRNTLPIVRYMWFALTNCPLGTGEKPDVHVVHKVSVHICVHLVSNSSSVNCWLAIVHNMDGACDIDLWGLVIFSPDAFDVYSDLVWMLGIDLL